MADETIRIDMDARALSDGSKVYRVDVSRVQYATKDNGDTYRLPVVELRLDAIDKHHAEQLLDALSGAIATHTNEVVLS